MHLCATVVASLILTVATAATSGARRVTASESSARPTQSCHTRLIQVGLAGLIGT